MSYCEDPQTCQNCHCPFGGYPEEGDELDKQPEAQPVGVDKRHEKCYNIRLSEDELGLIEKSFSVMKWNAPDWEHYSVYDKLLDKLKKMV